MNSEIPSIDSNGILVKDVLAKLPIGLENKKYRCDVCCYNEKYADKILPIALCAGVARVTANKVDREHKTLFTRRQVFYVSAVPVVDKVLDKALEKNHVPSIRVSLPSEFDWDDYYNISVEQYSGEPRMLAYHETVEGEY